MSYKIKVHMTKSEIKNVNGLEVDFKVNKNRDVLQSFKDENGRAYAKARYSEHLNEPNWWEIQERYIEHWRKYLEKNKHIQKVCQYTTETPSKQYPYKVYLYGCDDSSYTRCFSDKKEALKIMAFLSTLEEELDTVSFVKELGFIFTN